MISMLTLSSSNTNNECIDNKDNKYIDNTNECIDVDDNYYYIIILYNYYYYHFHRILSSSSSSYRACEKFK